MDPAHLNILRRRSTLSALSALSALRPFTLDRMISRYARATMMMSKTLKPSFMYSQNPNANCRAAAEGTSQEVFHSVPQIAVKREVIDVEEPQNPILDSPA